MTPQLTIGYMAAQADHHWQASQRERANQAAEVRRLAPNDGSSVAFWSPANAARQSLGGLLIALGSCLQRKRGRPARTDRASTDSIVPAAH